MRVSVRWAVLVAVGVATVVSAQGSPPRLSLAPVRGDKNNAVGSQLNGELCKAYDCVPFSKVSSNKKPDWAKARKEKVAGIITTNITKTKKGYSAGIALLVTSKVKRSWSFPLTSKRNLSGAQIKQLTTELAPSMGLAEDLSGVAAIAAAEAKAAPPPPVATTTPQSRMDTAPPPETLALIPPPPGAAPTTERSLADTPVSADAASSSSTPSGVRGQPLVTVDVGGSWLTRDLSYTPTDQTGLRTYSTPNGMAMLYVGVELFPFAKGGSFLAGLGIFGNYQLAIGLKSQTDSGLEESTSFSMLAAGIEARIRPIKYSDFAIVIPVAFRTYSFSVSNNNLFVGLPNQSLLGVSAGLKIEIPLGSWFVILAGGDYVIWFQKQQLIGNTDPAYFPSGSAGAFEAEVGFAIYIVGPLSVRVLGEYSNTSYSFNPDPSGTYNATGASDRLIGVRGTLRLEF